MMTYDLQIISSPRIMCVQYRRGAQYRGGNREYRGDIMSTVGGYLEYRGGVQYCGGIISTVGLS